MNASVTKGSNLGSFQSGFLSAENWTCEKVVQLKSARSQTDPLKSSQNLPNFKYEDGNASSPKCLMLNAQSIRSKFEEFKCYVFKEQPDLVCITECWLNEERFWDRLEDFEFNGFHMFSYSRSQSMKGGGVLIYVNCMFSAIQVKDIDKNKTVEFIWHDITLDVLSFVGRMICDYI